MSAAEPAKRPPSFYVSDMVDVEIRVSPRQLEREGWVYVGKPEKGKGTPPLPLHRHAVDAVRQWHDQTHEGAWQWCTESPCADVRTLPVPEDDE